MRLLIISDIHANLTAFVLLWKTLDPQSVNLRSRFIMPFVTNKMYLGVGTGPALSIFTR